MADIKNYELSLSLSKAREKAADTYQFPIRIINKSSIGFQKAEVAVKDTESNEVDTAYFGYIAAKTTSTEYVNLPGGIEFCTFRIFPDVGDDIVGGGIASNAPGVDITIND